MQTRFRQPLSILPAASLDASRALSRHAPRASVRASWLVGALLACGFSARADVVEVDNETLAALLADGATVIDVRREDEWRARGVLEGSHPLTFFDREGRHDVPSWLAELETRVARDETVVLVCAHGVRSKRIATLLDERLGFEAVHNVTDGIEGWRESGGVVTRWVPRVP